MRYMGLVALAALTSLTACGGGTENKTKAASAENLRPGQYEVASEVTQFRQADEGTAAFNTAVGTRETRSVCLAGAVTPDLFAAEGLTCREGSSSAYMRGGTISSTYLCSAPGRTGDVTLVIDGTFTEDGFEVTRNLRTAFSGEGDIVAGARLTGRRTGECTAPAPGANSAAPAKSN